MSKKVSSGHSSGSTSHLRIKDETKAKFDALLKQALIKNRKRGQNRTINRNSQELVSDADRLSTDTEIPRLYHEPHVNSSEVVEVDVHEDAGHDSSFILNKFFNDSSKMEDSDEFISLDINEPGTIFIKPPVPHPRKSKSGAADMESASPSSTGTYNVTSPVAMKVKDAVINNFSVLQQSSEVGKTSIAESISSTDSKTADSVDTKIPAMQSVKSQIINSSQNSPLSGIAKFSTQNSLNSNVTEAIAQKSPRSCANTVSQNKDTVSERSRLSYYENDKIIFENEIKRKRYKQRLSKYPPSEQEDIGKDISATNDLSEENIKYSYRKIIGITVHRTDRLKLDSLVVHPVVKIHIVNTETGEYIDKSDKNRPVVYFYENKDIPYITPVISEPFSLYQKRSLYPAWEETLVINEDMEYILASENRAIIFFEIMDFVSFSVASSQFNQKGSSKGWHKIAWAFLKPRGKNGASNVDKKVRLQLYYPGKHKKIPPHICSIFHWWHDEKLLKYPASLHASVRAITPPEKEMETLRSKTPIQGEKASRSNFGCDAHSNQLENQLVKRISDDNEHKIKETKDVDGVAWSRLDYQTCKLPNKCIAEFPSHEEGCLVLKFSHNGLYLACAVLIDDVYTVKIFSLQSHEEIRRYSGHQGLIYSISWSADDQLIVTASADCTVCVWSFNKHTFIEMLPHPSYIYTSEISITNVIATGCYDHTVRIWCSKARDGISFDLIQELEGHKGYITSLCFNKKSTALYSSDSSGMIIEWKNTSAGNHTWSFQREFSIVDLRGTVINEILLHKRERRLLIHARDSALRIIDLRRSCVLNWLQGAVNNRYKTTCSFSSCGNFIFAGGENGLVTVWNTDTGQLVATYVPYNAFHYYNLPIHCVQFHPYDNILAVCHYGNNLPILLALYDPALDGKSNMGLRLLQNEDEVQMLQKRARSGCSTNTESVIKKTAAGDNDVVKQNHGKIKFEDVMQKIDQIIINQHYAGDSSRTSTNN